MPTFHTPDPVTATVELAAGNLRVSAGDRTETAVTVSPTNPGADRDVKAVEQTAVTFTDGGLRVTAPTGKPSLFGKVGSVDVLIELPTGSALHGTAAMAEFRTEGTLGETRIRTSGGAITLESTGSLEAGIGLGDVTVARVDGHAEVSVESGKIDIGQVGGTALLKNTNGDTRLDRITGDLTVEAQNGGIRIGEILRGVVSLRTANGGIQVGVHPGTNAQVEARTASGDVRNELENLDTAEEKAELRASSTHGNVRIHRSTAG